MSEILTPEQWPSDDVLWLNLEAYDSAVARCKGDGVYPHDAEQPTRCPTCGASAWQALLIRRVLALRAKLTEVERERDRLAAEVGRLREASRELLIDARRLCDRMAGGTYEEDCRRSITQMQNALSPEGKE